MSADTTLAIALSCCSICDHLPFSSVDFLLSYFAHATWPPGSGVESACHKAMDTTKLETAGSICVLFWGLQLDPMPYPNCTQHSLNLCVPDILSLVLQLPMADFMDCRYIFCSSAGVYLKSGQMPYHEMDTVDPTCRHKVQRCITTPCSDPLYS